MGFMTGKKVAMKGNGDCLAGEALRGLRDIRTSVLLPSGQQC